MMKRAILGVTISAALISLLLCLAASASSGSRQVKVCSAKAAPHPGSGRSLDQAVPVARLAISDAMPTIDVLVLHTSGATDYLAQNKQKLDIELKLAISTTNTAFELNKIPARVRLVGTRQIAFQESDTCDGDIKPFAESPLVGALRAQYKADQVTLVRSPARDAGVGYGCAAEAYSCPEDAFSVIGADCIVHYRYPDGSLGHWMCFTHELAHNLGAGHRRGDVPSGPHRYDDSYGFALSHNGQEVADIMSYYAADSRVSYFSDPTTLYGNVPFGDALSNNARAVREMAPRAARYR